tara:strand:- start:297 stop:593 length:297 start_codon:yes stop_codon:yes gene_type:complete
MNTCSAIRTRFVGPTNYRPARIIASDDGSLGDTRKVTVSYDHALNGDENHKAAAQAFMDKHIVVAHCRAVVEGMGYSFGGEIFWTWTFENSVDAQEEN